MKTEVIRLSDLEDYFALQRLELGFRINLTSFKELAKRRLILVEKLQEDAKTLKQFKQKFENRFVFDKDLDEYIMRILNNKFDGLGVK